MASKALPLALKVSGIGHVAANILKQEALARGGDVVTSRDNLLAKEGATQVIIIGTENMMKSLAQKIRLQPFGLKEVAGNWTGTWRAKIRKLILRLTINAIIWIQTIWLWEYLTSLPILSMTAAIITIQKMLKKGLTR
ncbi:MAG: hypothetical protein U5N58_07330 [Actinomycetota bacterium]|nr:hypothetical protein [Actinomycetota bacterium]